MAGQEAQFIFRLRGGEREFAYEGDLALGLGEMERLFGYALRVRFLGFDTSREAWVVVIERHRA